MARFAAVVVAAGSGTRLGAVAPKALLELGGRALVDRAVALMAACGADPVVVVVPAAHREEFAATLRGRAVTLVDGGAERQQSVLAGLDAITDPAPPVVLVHDAARPLVPPDVVERVVGAVEAGARAVIPVVPVTDTVRRVDGDTSELLDRSRLRAVQTPQGFDRVTLVGAHRRYAATPVTDDATLCELAGHPVALVDGSTDALKITHPFDVVVAEALLARRANIPTESEQSVGDVRG